MIDRTKMFPATAMPDPDWWQALWPDPLRVLRDLGFREGMTAADLCCGDGHFTAPMSKPLGGRLHALELDPEMPARAREAIAASGPPVW